MFGWLPRWRPLALTLSVACPCVLSAQSIDGRSATAPVTMSLPLSRQAAVARALATSPLVALAAADRSSADAAVGLARQWENPTLGAQLTKSGPQQHYSLDVPLDPWWQRTPRIQSAQAAQAGAQLRYLFATRSIAFDTDTAYTRAQLTAARSLLSARTARDADSLLVLARIRRDAGDASELDVELASVFAGQARNAASSDSVTARFALLSLQTVIALPVDSGSVSLTDSLTLDAVIVPDGRSASVLLDAAARDVRAAELRVDAERSRRFGAPSVSFGFEAVDPGGQTGALAMAGISLPFPIFNRNGPSIAAARADLSRAQAQLAVTRLATSAAIAAARRDAEAARQRAQRSSQLVASANRIATMSLLAYREGASTLLVVLEAQRTARETLGQFYDDVAAARTATSLLTLLSTPAPESRP